MRKPPACVMPCVISSLTEKSSSFSFSSSIPADFEDDDENEDDDEKQQMKSSAHIVHGGGWVVREAVGRPKARFCTFLSVIWFGISIPASLPLWNGWSKLDSGVEWCSLLILPHTVF